MIRYLIFGAGAIGTLIGGLLAGAGHQVTFIGRKWNVEGIRNNGIRIQGVWGEHTIPPQPAYESVEQIPESARNFDQVLICVKAFSTAEAISACKPLLNESTLVISFQNGYGNCQLIAEHIGWHHTLGARVITGAELRESGMIHVTVHADSVRLGHYYRDFPMQHLESIALTMKEAGIPIEATEQLEQFIWAKIVYNAALNPTGALLGVTYGQLAENEETQQVMKHIVNEAFSVTKAHGIKQFWDSADEYLEAFYQKMIPPTAAHFPSMLRDLEKKRRTEIDVLNGAISKLGKEKQIPTPYNDTITSLIRFRESLTLS